MKHVKTLALLGLALLVSACGASAMIPKDAADGMKTEACIEAQVNAGQTTFEELASACGGLVVQNVVDGVATAIAAEAAAKPADDAGTKSAAGMTAHVKLLAVHHK